MEQIDCVNQLPEGPYFVQSNSLYPTWRFYADTNDAFVLPTILYEGSHNMSIVHPQFLFDL